MAKTTIKTDPEKLAHECLKVGNGKIMNIHPMLVEHTCRAANCRHSEVAIVSPAVYDPNSMLDKDSFEAVYYCYKHVAAGEPNFIPPCKLGLGLCATCKDYDPFVGTETIDLF